MKSKAGCSYKILLISLCFFALLLWLFHSLSKSKDDYEAVAAQWSLSRSATEVLVNNCAVELEITRNLGRRRPGIFSGEVFGIGLFKTGSTSLEAALLYLGIPTCSAAHVVKKEDLEAASPEEIVAMISDSMQRFNCSGVRGAVTALAYKELDQRFPSAKFILTLRSSSSWILSYHRYFKKHKAVPSYTRSQILHQPLSEFDEERYSNHDYDQLYIQSFDNYTVAVQRYFSEKYPERELKEKLLVINISQPGAFSWKRLCPFLQLTSACLPLSKDVDATSIPSLEGCGMPNEKGVNSSLYHDYHGPNVNKN